MAEQYKCAFSQTLLQEQFGCRNALAITRREGPDVCCTSAAVHADCAALFERMKAAALTAMAVVDDPLQMPRSVVVKVQFGGLLGLQAALDVTTDRVEDIAGLVGQALARYGDPAALPYDKLAEDIAAYQIKRRRGR
jgi:hypothetical protein